MSIEDLYKQQEQISIESRNTHDYYSQNVNKLSRLEATLLSKQLGLLTDTLEVINLRIELQLLKDENHERTKKRRATSHSCADC